MTDIASLTPNGKSSLLDFERARLAELIKTRSNGHDLALSIAEPDRARKPTLDQIIAAEARCAPAHVREAREVIRAGREDLIIGTIFTLVSITAHSIVKPRPVKPGLCDRRRQLLDLLGGG